MHTFERSIVINAPIDVVFHFHDDPQNLLKISPPNIKVKLISATPAGKGQRVVLDVTQFGFVKSRWEAEITLYEPPFKMVDVLHKSPFHSWKQTRLFEKLSDTQTRLTDRVDYELPIDVVSNIFVGWYVKREIESMFAFRQKKTKELLEAQFETVTASVESQPR
jgi:ligand-binding SRPBCC domain-containing protein